MGDQKNKTIKAHDESVYYSGKYWNDYGYVNSEIKRRVTGSRNQEWYEYFFASQKKRKFKKALILNCGNGWVEREIYQLGLMDEVVGVDYSDKLLKEAREKAGKLPLRYYQMDINTATFPEEGFDLVINHAAGHHIARIDRVFRKIKKIMTNDGVFVSYDYVGPHRNQYSIDQWAAAQEVNKKLPEKYRQDMKYPHLPTMLVHDPSEAIHSELILPTCQRYFDIIEQKHAGGAIAYLLLTHNPNFKILNSDERWLEFVMQKDMEYLKAHPGSSMFDYWAARPKKTDPDKNSLDHWEKEENLREKAATAKGGLYYENNFLQDLYLEREDLLIKNSHLTADIHRLARIDGRNNKQKALLYLRRLKRAAAKRIK